MGRSGESIEISIPAFEHVNSERCLTWATLFCRSAWDGENEVLRERPFFYWSVWSGGKTMSYMSDPFCGFVLRWKENKVLHEWPFSACLHVNATTRGPTWATLVLLVCRKWRKTRSYISDPFLLACIKMDGKHEVLHERPFFVGLHEMEKRGPTWATPFLAGSHGKFKKTESQ